jgi:hypothetical protein
LRYSRDVAGADERKAAPIAIAKMQKTMPKKPCTESRQSNLHGLITS